MENFLGEKLKKYRQENNLTQRQLAELLFVSDKTISKWERGAGLPDIETLKQVGDLLGLSVDDLLREREPNFFFEYKSSLLFFGLPLLHIVIPNLGEIMRYNFLFTKGLAEFRQQNRKIPVAKGIFCAGIQAKGIFSVGVLSLGIFSFGIASCGILAGGLASIGLIALGNFALGLLAFANFSLALIAIGNLAIGYFSLGNFALGFFALGNQSSGTWAYELGNDFGLSEIQQALHSLQLEEIPNLARQFLIQPLTVLFESDWLFPVFVFCIVAFILSGVIILTTASIIKIFRASRVG